ncbi:Coiled-coil domain-containing protein, partial [Termitomyces sp. J132]
RYYPPDYDPSHGSLNSYRGKHALGDRARKIDQGILITRFELPFNIWCGTCNNHIGMGVRYNAEKKKIGNYYSTPIYSFRCKCHLCDGWFEIQTDPKNTRYVVVSGAKQKNEDWNPEENGGFAIHGAYEILCPDTEETTVAADPLATLEKTTDAQNHLRRVEAPRLESLQTLSENYNADPYTLSSKVRKRFREIKKVEQQKQKADDHIRNRYGLPATLRLLEEDEASIKEAKEEWDRGQRELATRVSNKRRRLAVDIVSIQSSSSSPSTVKTQSSKHIDSLRARILENTARRTDPFGRFTSGTSS